MKKTLGIFSLVIMLFSQIITPFTYATGDVSSLLDGDLGKQGSAPEVLKNENFVEGSGETNNIKQQGFNGGLSQNNSGSSEVNPEAVPGVDTQSGFTIGTINEGETESLKSGEKVKEEYSEQIQSGDKKLDENMVEDKGIIETVTESIKSFLGLGEEYKTNEIRGELLHQGVRVEVYAAPGLFENGTVLTIDAVTGMNLEAVHEVLSGEVNLVEDNVDERNEKSSVVAFDISFRNPDTLEEVQPLTGAVQVTFNYEKNELLKQAEEHEEQEVKVYHLNDINDEGEKIEEITGAKLEEVVVNEEKSEEENKIVVEAEKFSIYTIVTQVKEEGPSAVTENQLANFEYGMISIEDPNNPGNGITIMDRNLGAIQSGTGTSFLVGGYLYQWGNNYGFSNSGNLVKISNNRIDTTGFGPGNNYYSDTYIIDSSNWSSINNRNLWGGESDTLEIGGNERTYGVNKDTKLSINPEDRQGPCPDGWHVPSIGEWSTLIGWWVESYGEGISIVVQNGSLNGFSNEEGIRKFKNYFRLSSSYPRGEDASLAIQQSSVLYQTSTSEGDDGMIPLEIKQSELVLNQGNNRSKAYPIRCFKNDYIPYNKGELKTVTFNFNGGSGSTASINVVNGEKVIEPSEPQKEGYVFDGWYKEDTYENKFNFSEEFITEDIELFAKWIRKGAIIIRNIDGNIIQINEQEYNDLDIYIITGGGIGHYTIMDRNLGASMTGEGENADPDSYGYYYQWGNNYGFLGCGTNGCNNFPGGETKKDIIEDKNVRSKYVPSKYARNMFTTNSTRAYNGLDNDSGIWGGTGDDSYLEGLGTTKEGRRGPCPEGYYVPSAPDLKQMVSDWKSVDIKMSESGYVFSRHFLMPFAGYRNYDGTMEYIGERASLRTSSIYFIQNGNQWIYNETFSNNWINKMSYMSVSTGSPIRCFKIKKNNGLMIHTNRGQGGVIGILSGNNKLIVNSLGELTSKVGTFLGWYASDSFEESSKIKTGDDIKNVTDIYALFDCGEGYFLSGDYKCYKTYTELLPGKEFNSIIKSLAKGSEALYSDEDYIVEKIQKYNGNSLDLINARIVSSEYSASPVYAWYDSETKTIYYYSESEEIYLNPDSSDAFFKLKSLKSIDIENLKANNVETMDSMFNNCSSLESINLTTFVTPNLKTMGAMFAGCSELISVNLSGLDISNIVSVNSMFYGSPKLKYVNMNGWNWSNRNNMGGKSVFSISYGNNPIVNLSARGWKIPNNFGYGLSNLAYGALRSIDVSDWDLSETTNIYGLFYYQKSLDTIIGLESWDVSNVTEMDYMFYSCENLIKLDLTSFNTSRVNNMSSMFQDAKKLKTIYVGDQFLTGSITSSSSMFSSTSSIIGGNGTKYNSSKINKEYAQIDNENQSGYFTDPNNITVRFYDLNGNELGTQHIAVGENAEKIFGEEVKYYTGADKQHAFNFTKGLDGYTEVYVDGYKVTFHPNNGGDDIVKYISSDGNIGMVQVSVEKKGYNFDGWYDNPDLSGEPYDLSTAITNDISLYAKWTFNCDGRENYDEEYDVCYKSNKLTINYIYQDNSQAAPKYEVYLSSGSPYCVDSPIIDNYIATPLKQNGTIGFIATNLDVRYMPTNNGGYIDPIIIGDEEPILSIPNFGTLVTSSNTSEKTNKVTIHYQDEFGTKLFEDYSGNHTGLYTIKSPVSDNFDADQTLIKGMACGTDTEYTVVYKIKDTIQNEYEIKFIDGSVPNRKVIYTGSYGADLSNLTYPQNWTKKGYTISWDKIIPEKMPLGGDIITASWVANTYKVSFNANQEGVENPSDMSVTYDTAYGTLPSLTKAGYNFNGWKDGDDFVTPYYIFTTDSDVTLIGDWSANSNTPYTVEYYYQQSDGKYLSTPTNKNTSRVGTTDTSVSVTANDKIPAQSGYAFDIDNDNNVLEGKVLGNGSLKLKVYFKKQFTVKYLPGEKGLFAQQINENLDYGVLTPSFGGSTDNHEEGYIFSGWNPEITETVTEDTTYIATWNEDKNKNGIADDKEIPFTVKFLAGDNGELGGVKEFLVLSGLKLSDIEGYQTPVIIPNTNYVFSGWSPVLDVNEKIQSNVNYTAIWGEDKNNNGENDEFEPKYTIIYTDGVDTGEIFKDQITENILSGIQTPEFSGNLTRLNYVFSGWNPSIIENVTGDVVYIAQWQDDMNNNGIADDLEEKYLITIKDGNTILATIELVSGVVISLPTPPSKIGYVFDGWSGLPADGKSVDKTLNITAKWKQINRNVSSAGGGFLSTLNNKNVFKDEKSHNSASLTGETQNGNKADEKNVVDMNDSNNKDNTEKGIQEQSTSTVNSNKEVFATSSHITYPEEIIDAYTWAKSKDITTIQTLDEAMPDGVVKRGHLAKMVVNYATNILGREIPEKIPSECRWNDNIKDWESEEIKDYAVKSCALGLMGLDMPKFLPNLDVTRAQFGTIMSRLLWGKKYAGGTPYYRKHLNALKENNIMTQLENPENRIELRQWVWLMLMRSAENK